MIEFVFEEIAVENNRQTLSPKSLEAPEK